MFRLDNSRASLLKPKAPRKSKHFPHRVSAPPPVLDCDELLASAAGKRLADPAVPAVAPQLQRPGVALVIKKRWCDEIFEGSKVWEIRGSSLAKRGRICIAQSKSQMLVGEVLGCKLAPFFFFFGFSAPTCSNCNFTSPNLV